MKTTDAKRAAIPIMVLMIAGIGCITVSVEPRIRTVLPQLDGTRSVLDYGAVGDGSTDNTVAFQAALDDVGKAGGGIVSVPAGRYSFAGSIRVPKEVVLKGVYVYAPSHAGFRDKNDEMPVYNSVLMPRANANNESGPPFIELDSNSVIQGFCIYYPDQLPDAAQPTAYPYAISMRNNNPAILDVELLNPYNGIDASRNQRALIRNVHGQPIHIGVYVDSVYDIGRIENVHWNPWWSLNTPVYQWQMDHGVGFKFGRTDWHYVLNTFCYGYHVGYQFIETSAGATNGNFLGIGADDCQTSIEIQGSAPFGILITNGEFVSFHGPDPTMVRVTEDNEGSVRFVNCAYWGPCNRIATIAGTGTVGFSDCTFVQWAHKGQVVPAIEAVGGSVLIRGCEFKEDKPQISLSGAIQRAIITDNLLTGAERISVAGQGAVVISNNVSR